MGRPLACPKCGCRVLTVVQLKSNYSAFNGYRYTPSDYSLVRCTECQWPWRTKSDQVYGLPWQPAGEGRPKP